MANTTMFPSSIFGGSNHNSANVSKSKVSRKKKKIDLSVCDPEDRAYVKKILQELIKFEDPTPDIDIVIWPVPDSYNVAIAGWTAPINDETWFKMFLQTSGPDRRDAVFDPIIRTETTPSLEDGQGPIKLIVIKRSGFHSRKHK